MNVVLVMCDLQFDELHALFVACCDWCCNGFNSTACMSWLRQCQCCFPWYCHACRYVCHALHPFLYYAHGITLIVLLFSQTYAELFSQTYADLMR